MHEYDKESPEQRPIRLFKGTQNLHNMKDEVHSLSFTMPRRCSDRFKNRLFKITSCWSIAKQLAVIEDANENFDFSGFFFEVNHRYRCLTNGYVLVAVVCFFDCNAYAQISNITCCPF